MSSKSGIRSSTPHRHSPVMPSEKYFVGELRAQIGWEWGKGNLIIELTKEDGYIRLYTGDHQHIDISTVC